MSDINRDTLDTLDYEGFGDGLDKPPGLAPSLPLNITELTDARLMDAYREFLEWGAYAGARLASIGADILVAEERLRLATATAAFLAKDTVKTVTAAKQQATADPDVQAANAALINLQAHKIHMTQRYDFFEKSALYCSRELSRRLARRDRENRDAKWGI
jgi:hypothetical protein